MLVPMLCRFFVSMKTIKLTKGEVCLLDDEDFNIYGHLKWCVSSNGYAKRNPGTKVPHVYLHRLIAGAKKGQLVDHINGNRLDNRRDNLRLCGSAGNTRNSGSRGGSSQFKGVYRQNQIGQWSAQVTVQGKAIWIGNFRNERHAAMAVDLWNREDSFNKLNFIPALQ